MSPNFWKKVKRMTKSVIDPEPENLKTWKKRLEEARESYGSDKNRMKTYQGYYDGDRSVAQDPNSSYSPSKKASNVRNIVYELIESQVDSSIPMPKVRAIHPEDEELAKKLEHYLENKIKTAKLPLLNDMMERNVPVQGGDFFHVQWDANAGLHSQIGDIKVSEIHPKKLIPQPGMVEIEEMDYFFVQELYTKKKVKAIYGVSVEDCGNDYTDLAGEQSSTASINSDIVTVNTAYYHNEHGGVGIFVWCDTEVLLDLDDYEARYLDHCAKCGAVMQNGVCPECGSKKVKKMPEEYEEMAEGMEVKTSYPMADGTFSRNIDPFTEEEAPQMDENGQPVMDEMGQPVMEVRKVKRKIPYYKPNIYPVVLRKNITQNDRLLGGSDVAVIIDQQDTVKKLGSKINEKLLKGGSFVTLPTGIDVEKTDKELKILRVRNAADKSLIDVINVQPNVQNDLSYEETNYNWAKSALGITDSFQGKFSSSEVSGTARQYAINQAAGRLESKRTLKNEAFAKLYEYMFKFWLAYSDQSSAIISTDSNGTANYDEIDRHEFLKIDSAGEFYWDDEFLFETDPTSTLMQNREALWNQTDLKLQSGAFGPVGDLETARAYWTIQKANGYPNAAIILNIIEQRIKEQQEMAMQAQQAMPQEVPEEGATDEMPEM
jgi:predicted  nucleic acid-binding Zn-ribbon protein